MTDPFVLSLAFLGGVLPALLWLIFWQLEDRCDPEPKWRIVLCFIAGMITVPLVLPLQYWAQAHFTGNLMLLIWATGEELLKFAAAWLIALRGKVVDEPIDAIVYMVTAALGFAALENTLFLVGPLTGGDTLTGLITGNVRFVGATLLHTLASATIGISLAISFYKSKSARRWYLFSGVILAILLHALFNVLILKEGGTMTFPVFLLVWVGVIAVLLFFERLKRPSRDYC